MRRLVLSLVIGLFATIALVVVLLFLRALHVSELLSSAVVWMFLWPFPLFACLPLGDFSKALLTFSFAVSAYIGVVSFVIYKVLRILSRRRVQQPPPQFATEL